MAKEARLGSRLTFTPLARHPIDPAPVLAQQALPVVQPCLLNAFSRNRGNTHLAPCKGRQFSLTSGTDKEEGSSSIRIASPNGARQ
jgi:hypothetical protein